MVTGAVVHHGGARHGECRLLGLPHTTAHRTRAVAPNRAAFHGDRQGSSESQTAAVSGVVVFHHEVAEQVCAPGKREHAAPRGDGAVARDRGANHGERGVLRENASATTAGEHVAANLPIRHHEHGVVVDERTGATQYRAIRVDCHARESRRPATTEQQATGRRARLITRDAAAGHGELHVPGTPQPTGAGSANPILGDGHISQGELRVLLRV